MTDAARAGRYRLYLLGELPAPERDALEDGYFATDEGLAELQDAEDDLIEAYEAGTLSSDDRLRFETRYLQTAEGARRLVLDRALTRLARGRTPMVPPAERSRPPIWLTWAAGLAIAGLTGGLAWSHWRLRAELRQAHDRNETLQREAEGQVQRIDGQQGRLEAMRADLERLRERAEQLESLAVDPGRVARLVSLLLRPGLKRDLTPVPELTLPPDAVLVRLALAVEGTEAGPYRASLQTVDGRELWARSRLAATRGPEALAVRATVPAGSLAPGHYVVVLSSDREPSSPLAEYVFRVRRR